MDALLIIYIINWFIILLEKCQQTKHEDALHLWKWLFTAPFFYLNETSSHIYFILEGLIKEKTSE